MEKKNLAAVLPIQIACYAGLRIGEACGLTWQDSNLDEQYLTVKRIVRYDGAEHRTIIEPTKRKKARRNDFRDMFTAKLFYKNNIPIYFPLLYTGNERIKKLHMKITLSKITEFGRNIIMGNLLIKQLQEVMPSGMQIPEEIKMLYQYIEDNGLFIDNDGCRYGFLYPEDKLQKSRKKYERDGKTIYERDGGTMISFAACGAANLKDWFHLEENRKTELRELEQRLCVFAQTGCEDSQSAFWISDQGDLKIVHMGSGSGSTLTCVLADNALDFIRLLAIGYDEICWDKDFPYPPNEIPYSDVIVKPNTEFQNWVTQTFRVEIPRTALEIVKYPAHMDTDTSEDEFFNWIWKF